MSQNHLIVVALIELLVLYLIVYSIKIARKWAINKTELCEEMAIDLPTALRNLRKDMRYFNVNLKKKFIPQPLSVDEVTSILGEIATHLLRSKIPVLSMDKKFVFLTTLYKIWKLRKRIIVTFAQRFLKTAY